MENQLIRNYVEMLAATVQFFCISSLWLIGPIAMCIILYTKFWYMGVMYLIWIWIIDKDTSEKGGRKFDWIRGLKLHDYARDYYPVTLNAVPGFQLDPKKNYMFCCFPHGVMPNGIQIALSSKSCGIDDLLPNHTLHPLTLHMNFKIPIFREYMLSLGACSVTPKSINWLLGNPKGGRIAAIVVGGAAEAFHSSPGVYKLVLRNRKGFIKLALKNGSPLVPVFSFGEVDVFRQFKWAEDSWPRRFQEWCKKKTRIIPIFFTGRGYYQGYFGLVPFRRSINVVIGKPIVVEKNTNPSEEEIDKVHQIFIKKINELFEEYKHKYIQNAEQTTLTLV